MELMRQYQKDGAAWLRERNAGLLADDVGLGKTAEVVAAIHDRGPYPVLIVCPKTLCLFWAKELITWSNWEITPQDIQFIDTQTKLEDISGKYCIVHWEIVWRVKLLMYGKYWGTVILDEAHRLKNRLSQQSSVLRTTISGNRYAVTATPVKNSPADLWAILNFLWPEEYNSYWRWFHRHVDSWSSSWGGYEVKGWRVVPDLDGKMLRRTREEVLAELPAFTETIQSVELTPRQRKAYNDMRELLMAQVSDDEIIYAVNAISRYTRLRQICSSLSTLSTTQTDSAKVDAVLDIIAQGDLQAPPVIFTAFIATAQQLYDNIPNSVLFTGAVGGFKREAEREAFQRGERSALIATIGAGGEGITLTHADTVILLERPWTPAGMEQILGRLRRMGQKHDKLFAITLDAVDTVDQKIRRLLERKEGFAKALTGKEFKELL